MQPTVFRTLNVPTFNAATQPQPVPVYRAGKVPVRVLARAVVASFFLATDQGELITNPAGGGGTYTLPVTQADVFVLAPGETLYAFANATPSSLSLSVSEALPVLKTTE